MKKITVFALAITLSSVSISCKKGMDKIGNAVLRSGENESQAIIDFNLKNSSRLCLGVKRGKV